MLTDIYLLFGPDDALGGQAIEVPRELHVSRELTIPATSTEVAELARYWHREIQRNAGIVKFERP